MAKNRKVKQMMIDVENAKQGMRGYKTVSYWLSWASTDRAVPFKHVSGHFLVTRLQYVVSEGSTSFLFACLCYQLKLHTSAFSVTGSIARWIFIKKVR